MKSALSLDPNSVFFFSLFFYYYSMLWFCILTLTAVRLVTHWYLNQRQLLRATTNANPNVSALVSQSSKVCQRARTVFENRLHTPRSVLKLVCRRRVAVPVVGCCSCPNDSQHRVAALRQHIWQMYRVGRRAPRHLVPSHGCRHCYSFLQ